MSIVLEPGVTDVQMIVEEVWSSFLGGDEPLVVGAPGEFETGWSAAVTIAGAWEGMVSVELPTGAAEEVCRGMLGVDDIHDEDVADAVGELVNMIGGNVKSLIPGASSLSLPVVAAGRVARSSESTEVCRVDAWWAGSPLQVAVHAHRAR